MKITVDGVGINCEIEGRDGAPWVTFSNSLATDLTMWDDQAAALADDYRVLRYDKRGHGGSDPVEGPYDWDMLVGDVVGLWDALDIETSHFVGLSMGGMTAFGLALDHPGRLRGVVASNTRADAPPAFRDAWDERIAAVEAGGMAALAGPTVERWSSDSFFASGSPVLERLREMVRTTSVAGFTGCARALQGLDYEPRLGEIDSPMLFIAGKDDGATPSDNMRRLHGMVPGSQFLELSPAGHLSNIEQPEAYNVALRDFLAAH